MRGGDDPTGPSFPPGPPSAHGPEIPTPEWNDTSETKGEKIGELASTRRDARVVYLLRCESVNGLEDFEVCESSKNSWERLLAQVAFKK